MTATEPRAPRDQELLGAPVERAEHHGEDDRQDTVTGRRVSGPVQGFGQMWQKTFSVRVPSDEHPPEAVVAHWKAAFPTFWPKGSTFYAPLAGITPGEVALLEVPPVPGSPIKMSTGVLVIYADRESFTFMTPEGHALSAWITFSSYRDNDETVAQVQALERTSDPFIELSYMFGANRANDRFWERTLENLAPVPGRRRRRWSRARRSASTGAASGSTRATRVTARPCTWPSARSRRRRAGFAGGASGRDRRRPGTSRCGARARSSDDAARRCTRARCGRRRGGVRMASRRRSSWRAPGARSGSTRPPTTVGGGSRSAELTLPGFVHDVCSAVASAGDRVAVLPLGSTSPATGSSGPTPRRRSPTR